MRRLRAWFLRFGSLVLKERQDREFTEEIESHLQMQTEDNMQSGMAPEEAKREARLKLGGIEQVKERHRDRRGFPILKTLVQDVRFGARRLWRNPGFTLVIISMLALGIGATVGIFSVVYAILIRPLPYPNPQQLVSLWQTSERFHLTSGPVSGPNFLDWKRESNVFLGLAIGAIDNPVLTGIGEPTSLRGIRTTSDFSQLLGVQPMIGRSFLPDEREPGHEHVVILGHRLWERKFASDRAVVGKAITLDSERYTVIGVMSATFRFPKIWDITEPDLYVPFTTQQLNKNRDLPKAWVVGRLKPDVSVRRAQAQMTTIARRLAQQYPEADAAVGINVQLLQKEVESGKGPVLMILIASVGCLLLTACVNVANMLLAKAGGRQREMALRLAVGATRWRIVRQLLTESVLLSLIGWVASIPLGFWIKDALLLLSPQGFFPQTNPINLNPQVLALALAISIGAGILFGLAPALQGSKTNLQEWLREGARSSGSLVRRHLRNALVISEMGLALLLLIVAGLLMKSLNNLLNISLGFNPDNVLTMKMALPRSRYQTPKSGWAFCQSVLGRVSALPGIGATWYRGSCVQQ